MVLFDRGFLIAHQPLRGPCFMFAISAFQKKFILANALRSEKN